MAGAPELYVSLAMLDLGSLAFGPRGGGWAWWTTPDMPEPDGVALRFVERDAPAGQLGRLEVVELVVRATASGLTGELLRSVPVARLEAVANGPALSERIRAHVRHGRRRLDLSRFVPDNVRATALPSLSGPALPEDEPTAEDLADVDAALARATVELSVSKPTGRLKVPGSRVKPDEFYEQVARVYTQLAGSGPRPAAVIAEANGVPASTVHRWVREARRRGLLSAGERAAVQRPPRGAGR